MQITDVIADMLTRIRNANSSKHPTVDIPASSVKKAIAEILLEEGYIAGYEVLDNGNQGTISQGHELGRALAGSRRLCPGCGPG